MYEDAWYSFPAAFQQQRKAPHGGSGHRRKESLLQQNGTNDNGDSVEPLPDLFEELEVDKSPPEATLARRAKSYSDFYDIVKAQLYKDTAKKHRKRRKASNLDALAVEAPVTEDSLADDLLVQSQVQEGLLDASQQEYMLYHDQLAMTERHLETLIQDTNGALDLLESLSKSFRAVEDQTSSFRSQCDDLLTEQKRLERLADEVGTDLHYYEYLDNVTRRLNAPGASRLVDDEAFGEILSNLDSCIAFMNKNIMYRDAESYLARYQALLAKALHLLEVGFTARLEKVSTEIAKQITAIQSESARHALAYGRFEEMIMESYSLIPNVKAVVRNAYDQFGNPKKTENSSEYANTANNIFQAYLATRDRDLKPIVQSDLDTFKEEVNDASVETAVRNFIKQCYERSYSEAELFGKIFAIELHYSLDPDSVFAVLKPTQRSLVNGINIVPIANNLQATLASSDLTTVCNVIGWVTNEYLLLDYDDEETPLMRHCRELTARLLAEHLWTFTDAAFEAEIAKSISKAPILSDQLKISPVTDGVSSSNAYPPVKRALELLVMFDQSMPKERSQRDSPVIFKIVRESIAALQRAEARIKTTKTGTDPDLFMIKNLLIIKNELVSLEIGDVRNNPTGGGLAPAGTMQHFGQIWDTLTPQGLMGLISSIGSFIPIPAVSSSLWSLSRGNTPTPTPSHGSGSGTVKNRPKRTNSNATVTTVAGTITGTITGTVSSALTAVTGAVTGATAAAHPPENQDASEHLDDLLRQSIVAFTNRWVTLLNEARAAPTPRSGTRDGKQQMLGGKNLAKVERDLEEMLDRAFSNQPEVVGKLKEAIQISAQAQVDAAREKDRERERQGSRVSRV